MSSPLKLIVGLGNPGADYFSTRHNAGAWLVAALANRFHGQFRVDKKFQGEHCRITIGGHDLHCLIPTTFMNRSGQSVGALASYYDIPVDSILVAHDELDIETGTLRLKPGGGHGGHNGLRDIIAHLGSSDFHRLRIGIGHPGNKHQVHNYVLSRPSQPDRDRIDQAIDFCLDQMDLLLSGQFAKAQNFINGFTPN